MKDLSNTLINGLKNQQINYAKVFSEISNLALLVTLTGEIINCNKAMLELFKVSLNDVINKNISDDFCVKLFKFPPNFINEILQASPTSAISFLDELANSGKTIKWGISIIQLENNQKIICIQGIDISQFADESRMTKKIQDSIVDHLPNHYIFWKDKDSVYLGCNKAFASRFGFKSPADVIGKTDYDLPVKKEHSDAYRVDDQEVMRSKMPKLNIEELQTLAAGKTRILLTSKVPLFAKDGSVVGVLAIYSDITKQKQDEMQLIEINQKLEKANRAKTEFIRNMSHDIRTPLSGIIALSRFIIEEIDNPDLKSSVQDIQDASEHLLKLLNEIIETVQIEAGDSQPKKRCFRLKQNLDSLIKIFSPAIKSKKLTVNLFYDDHIPDILFGNEIFLHRIILNLLGNAVKFTENGSINIEVSLNRKVADKVYLKLVVSDTGIGIDADKFDFIFEKFSRLNSSYSNQYKGSGMGLYIVKEFIKKMGGDIKVVSQKGKGAQFICSIQFKIPTIAQLKRYKIKSKKISEEDKIILLNNVALAEQELKQKSIPIIDLNDKLCALLVEDTLVPRKTAEKLLLKEGYHVITAESAADAIEKSKVQVFDLIYMDIGLPDGTGIDVAKQIRTDPENPNKNTFIAALTAHADFELRQECFQAGMQYVFDKPLSSSKIEIAENLMNENFFAVKNKLKDFSIKESGKIPTLDLMAGIQMMGGNQKLAQEILDLFMSQLPEFKSNITEAYQKEDWDNLKHYVHKLHGGLCYTGAIRLKSIAHDFEVALNKKTGNYASDYEALIQEIKELEIEYHQCK